ncbi:hypothetical protein [Halopseudomonas salegens]|uniref:hypothetical protein n=1 Tax=Halopseudomonas salegens TaxID=1434072 RepID=UPI0012FD455C|nr:hypothetical protein [Halopseudomonas salegens]
MMNFSEKWQWGLAYAGPALLIAVPTTGLGLVMLPIGGFMGVFVGFTSDAPYFTTEFRVLLGVACLLAVTLFLTGIKFRTKFWGKVLNSMGVYLWCVSGLVGFGPQ